METQTTPGATLPNTLPVQTPPEQETQTSTANSQPFGSIQQTPPVTTGIHTSNLIPTASPIIIPITVPSPSTLQNSGTDVHQNMTDMQKIQASMEDQRQVARICIGFSQSAALKFSVPVAMSVVFSRRQFTATKEQRVFGNSCWKTCVSCSAIRSRIAASCSR